MLIGLINSFKKGHHRKIKGIIELICPSDYYNKQTIVITTIC